MDVVPGVDIFGAAEPRGGKESRWYKKKIRKHFYSGINWGTLLLR